MGLLVKDSNLLLKDRNIIYLRVMITSSNVRLLGLIQLDILIIRLPAMNNNNQYRISLK